MALALGCLLCVDILLTAAAGFRFGFTHDDLMNAHSALTRNWLQLASDTIRFWTVSPVYRPTGIAVLKLIYFVCGMNLLGWRLFYGALFCAAVLLSFASAWRLTGRFPVAVITGLLMSFHAAFRWLYFGMGFIFDVTALIFTCLFLLVWFHARTSGSYLFAALSLGLLILGIQCKEIAIDAIVFAGLYELVFSPPVSIRGTAAWIAERPILVIGACVGIVFAVTRLTDYNSLTQLPAYRLSLSQRGYFPHMAAWMRQIYTQPITARAGLIVVPCLMAAIWSSWRLSLWSMLSFCIGVLPLAFIEQRGAQELFVPSLPLAILAALAFDGICEAAARILPDGSGRNSETVRGVLVGIVCLLIVLRQGSVNDRQGGFTFNPPDLAIGRALESVRNLTPRPDPNGRIVVDSDPFESFEWADLFLFRLAFESPQLEVKRPSQLSDDDRRDDAVGKWRHIGWNGVGWTSLARRQSGPVDP